MKRILAIALTVVMLVSTIGMSGVVAAQEGPSWEADSCAEAPTLQPGSYSVNVGLGTGPVFKIGGVSPGDAINFQFEEFTGPLKDDGDNGIYIDGATEPAVNGFYYFGDDYRAEDGYSDNGDFDSQIYTEGGEETMILQNDVGVCIGMRGQEENGGVAFSFDLNNPAPAIVTESEAQALQDQIDSLQTENSELQDQVDSLQSELENADVTIDVSVEPENQATFQVGGAMAVNVNAQGASPSDVTLNFAGQEYTASGGEATIPLDSAGTQQLNINYQDTTETITLDVADQEEDTATDGDSSTDGGADDGSASSDDDGSTTDDDDSTSSDDSSTTDDDGSTDGSADDDGAGFGIVAALVALSGIGLLSHRQLTSESDQ